MTSSVQQVDFLDENDILNEADVYWTYGRWHQAMDNYRFWMHGHGTGVHHRVAQRYFDAAIHAQDTPAFVTMLTWCMDTLDGTPENAKFLQDTVMHGLAANPGNLDLLSLVHRVGLDPERVRQIIEQKKPSASTPKEKKQKIWNQSRHEAGAISVTQDAALSENVSYPIFSLPTDPSTSSRLKASSGTAVSTLFRSMEEQLIAYSLTQPHQLIDNAASDIDFAHEVLDMSRRRADAQPKNLLLRVDILRSDHEEAQRVNYAQDLLALSVVLIRNNAGVGLRKRLLSIGRIMGSHPIFDALSNSSCDLARLQKLYDSPQNNLEVFHGWKPILS